MVRHSELNRLTATNFMLEDFGHGQQPATHPKTGEFKNLFENYHLAGFDDLINKLAAPTGKRSFLVFKNHKYINILTENIAYFYVWHESTIIVTFDKQEYFVNRSLEQIQHLVSEKQFFRINRQYLVGFDAIKEAEHYFARKLLVNLVVPSRDKLIVSKERVTHFLQWLDER